jgi:hypothetical protein
LALLAGALLVPATAAAPVDGDAQQTLEHGDNWRWLSYKGFDSKTRLRVTVWVDDVGIDLRTRLPFGFYQTVNGVTVSVRTVRTTAGPAWRLYLLASNGRADPVTVKVRWRLPQPGCDDTPGTGGHHRGRSDRLIVRRRRPPLSPSSLASG